VLSSANGDLLADEIVNDSPNPRLASPVDVEVVEETKYNLVIFFSDVQLLRGFLLCVICTVVRQIVVCKKIRRYDMLQKLDCYLRL